MGENRLKTLEKSARSIAKILFFAIAFAFPFEYKYDKLFRYFSLSLIPEGVLIPQIFDKKIYFYASDIVALLLFGLVLFAFKAPLRRLFLRKETVFLWLYFLFVLISIFLSPLCTYPLIYCRLLQLLTPLFFYSFLIHSPLDSQKIFLVLIATALMQSGIAILQYALQSPLGLHLLSEPKAPTGLFHSASGCRWIFDHFFPHNARHTLMRASGTFPHCNVLGGFLALTLMTCYPLFLGMAKSWQRLLLGLAFGVQFFAMCLTFSRSALFGWTLGTMVWFSLALYHQGWRAVFSSKAVRAILVVIMASISLSGAILFEQMTDRGGILNYNSLAQGADNVRLGAQSVAIKMIQEHPFFGAGYQQFTQGAEKYLPPGKPVTGAHNIYLYIAAETGLLSLGAFLSFILILLLKGVRARYTPTLGALFGIFAALLFIGCCDYYPILFQQGRWMLFAMAALLAREATRSGFSCQSCTCSDRFYYPTSTKNQPLGASGPESPEGFTPCD